MKTPTALVHPAPTAVAGSRGSTPVGTPAGEVHSPAAAPVPTRGRVERLLLDEGPTTAASLADRLGLTPAAVRRHLDGMLADGTLVASSPMPTAWRERGRGRPARTYALSDVGHARARHAYDDLAADALAFLEALGAVEQFAAARAEELRARYAPSVGDSGTVGLAGALTKDGYAATVHQVATGTQICQHHCPVAGVATRFPQLCEAETAAFSALLGQHVQRLATIAHGDGVCTTHVPATPTTAQRRAASSAPSRAATPALRSVQSTAPPMQHLSTGKATS